MFNYTVIEAGTFLVDLWKFSLGFHTSFSLSSGSNVPRWLIQESMPNPIDCQFKRLDTIFLEQLFGNEQTMNYKKVEPVNVIAMSTSRPTYN